jgi:hypothetical protein
LKTYIGIDNGVSGTVGIITPDDTLFFKTPVVKQLSYTKTKKYINRIDYTKLQYLLYDYRNVDGTFCAIERPMINGSRFNASMSAIRALEATLIILERLYIPYTYLDSKEWQKEMLPNGLKGAELKTASLDIGNRLFPQFKDIKPKHPDRDGLLIAEYLRRKGL